MHIVFKDENNFTVFIHNDTYKKDDLCDKEKLENYFQNFFLNLRKRYQYNMNGFYIIDIYIDNIFGAIIDMSKQEVDYFDYFDSSIDMQISKPKNKIFLYKISDIFTIDKKILKKVKIYNYQNQYYLKIIKNINQNELAKLLEFADIIYDEKCDGIINFGKEMEV